MSLPVKISLQGVTKSFGAHRVLSGIDMLVHKGESMVILGGSGSGKSVMLKCILGLIEPDGGTIEIDGKETTHLHGKRRISLMSEFGMLFQGGALFDSLPVWENIAFGLLQAGTVSRKAAKDISIEKLRSVGLTVETADKYPAELSGGMQKRVALARAIAGDPEIIFFDEPTTGLDPIMADVINDLIVKCTKELGATTVTITHDMASARKIGDTVSMLYEGKLIWTGSAQKLDASGNPYVDQFVHGRAEGPIAVGL